MLHVKGTRSFGLPPGARRKSLPAALFLRRPDLPPRARRRGPLSALFGVVCGGGGAASAILWWRAWGRGTEVVEVFATAASREIRGPAIAPRSQHV